MTELHYRIPPEWRTLPLNRVLRQGLGFSALGLKSVRERGCVRLDGLVSPLYQTPGSAERLSIVLPEDPPSEIEPVTGRLHLLYEDTHLLIVDKPAGMAVHPGPGHHGDTLGNLLMGHYAQEGEQHLDEDEFVNVEKIPFAKLEKMVQEGDMLDGKTIAALYKTKLLLGL